MVLSKEEKKEARRMQKLRAEIEVRKKVKRAELQRELAAQSKKKKQLDQAFRDLVLKIKEPEFKQDTEILWHIFERAFDKKNHVINYTIKLLETADDQFQRTVASFCVSIDTAIKNFLYDLDALSKDNNKRTAILLKKWDEEASQIMKDHDVAESHLQLMIYHGHSRADERFWTARGDNIVRQDEDRTKYLDERENLRSQLENQYNLLWDEYKSVLKNYVIGIAENQKLVRKLRVKENLMSDIIESQRKRLASNDEILKRLRTELAAYESGTKQALFRDRRDRHRAATHKLKKRLINGCSVDLTKIELLVKESDGAIEWLQHAAKKGEKILRVAALCRKFEGHREKILPFGSTAPHSPTYTKPVTYRSKPEDQLVANAISTTCGLTRLWQRVSKAELTKRALYREKLLLEEENSYLLCQIEDFRENKYGPGSQKCSCTGKKGAINPHLSINGVLEVNRYKKL